MQPSIKLIGGVLLAAPLALAFGVPAGAASAPSLSVAPSTSDAPAAAVTPLPGKTAITTANVFKPVKVVGPKIAVGSTCSSTNYSFFIANRSGRTQQVTLGGSAFGSPMPAKSGLYVCGSGGTKPIHATFSLSINTAAVLTATIKQ
jgi:hypothetical protein